MASPTLTTVKRLFAISGNRCSFPDCTSILFQDDGTLIGEICHIKANRPEGPRYDSCQSDRARQGYANLILLCCNHHKVVDDQWRLYTCDVLSDMKAIAAKRFARPEREADALIAKLLLNQAGVVSIAWNSGNVAIDSPGAIQTHTLILKSNSPKATIAPPLGTVGADANTLRYAKYLIDRYLEFAKHEPSRGRPFSYAVIYKAIEREFGANWKLIPIARFDGLCGFLQQRILKTRMGKFRSSHSQASFSGFDEYLAKHGR